MDRRGSAVMSAGNRRDPPATAGVFFCARFLDMERDQRRLMCMVIFFLTVAVIALAVFAIAGYATVR